MTRPEEPIEEVRVDVESARAANRANWDDRARVHADSTEYDLPGLAADPDRISTVISDDVAVLGPHLPAPADPARPLAGYDVCHLQCHIGTDTLSLARLGGRLTGVDLSPVSLEVARDLADRAGVAIRFVESEVTAAADAVGERFDLVHTSIGTICWVADLDAWAHAVAGLLRPGGTFFFRDFHPFLGVFDDTVRGEVLVGNRYWPLPSGHAVTYDEALTYTDGDPGRITATRNYEWPHTIGEIVNALLGAGLRILALEEGRELPWQMLDVMVPNGDNWVLPPPWHDQLPATLSVVARRDQE
ncbi:methyltransferase domain-containing protein [Nocardioides panacisoli]|uniref:class I SAM-dependent methyltransferase n=1 Tax=Nocardioides panacisoli TaxID=627624 RepID=UPI001C634CDC|nr:class I SAM-dependent methyltransferase [Nocardioides panacisoli]QYJ04154.1 methyltransferase domain-containing protein [Nocardioides panacisoli]